MGSDRTSAGWVLMTMAIAAGWWYWNLLPEQKRALGQGAGLKPDKGGLYDPAAHPAGPEAGGGPPTEDQQRRGATPFDAGGRLANLFGES